ncbi:hypothetical protein BpHYR1_037228 [Brachionus plicatilis]|uniref:Uncharacterized protein n=1 Tax=Brachionus plicatilis TaxID=10195 RepID=A0A3M7PS85_BRAPC|nr:hypothetical protein BpHYR1_037228 [Brachionus plicatilis]
MTPGVSFMLSRNSKYKFGIFRLSITSSEMADRTEPSGYSFITGRLIFSKLLLMDYFHKADHFWAMLISEGFLDYSSTQNTWLFLLSCNSDHGHGVMLTVTKPLFQQFSSIKN